MDEALYASWHSYFENNAELEERDATTAGRWMPAHPDYTFQDLLDYEQETLREYGRL